MNRQPRKSKRGKPRRAAHAKDHSAIGDVSEFVPYANASMTVVSFHNPRLKDPFPQRYRTVMYTSVEGYIAPGTGDQRYFCVWNTGITPFNGGGWTNSTPAIGTVKPTGWSNICNVQMYETFRITASRIKVTFAPEAQVDSVNVTVTPSFLNSQPANTAIALGQPWTRNALIVEGQPRSSNTVINKTSIARLLGCTERAVQDDLSARFYGGYNTNPTILAYWVICFNVANSATTINNLPWVVEMEQEVEFFGDATADNIQTMAMQLRNKTI